MTNVHHLPTSSTLIRAVSRFWVKVAAPRRVGECWEWIGSKTTDGYGLFYANGKTVRAHRFIYTAYCGALSVDQAVLHACDNPSCVNPSHLRAGTQAENVQDMHEKGRAVRARGEMHGRAKLDAEKVLAIRAANEKHRDIAAKFGISRGLVSQIKSRTVWNHI